MNKLVIIFSVAFSNLFFGQESNISSEILSVSCDESIDASRFNTRLTQDSILANSRIIHFSTTATCCVDFEIKSELADNSIKIDLIEKGTPCECICAYNFVVRFNKALNSETKFYVKNRILDMDVPKLRMLEKRYFVFENDTTGFDDENGLRQGFVVFKRENDLKKIYYTDGKFVKLEITDRKGNVLITETDENKIFEY